MSHLDGYDMVLALSKGQIDLQLYLMWQNRAIPRRWQSRGDDGTSFDAVINAPVMGFVPNDQKHVQLSIAFVSGTFTCPRQEGGPRQRFEMAGWCSTFNAAIGRMVSGVDGGQAPGGPHVHEEAARNIRKIIQQSHSPESSFTLESFFLEVQQEDILHHDVGRSSFPGLPEPFVRRFQKLLAGFLEGIQKRSPPFVLSHILKPCRPEDAPALLAPTFCRYSISYKESAESPGNPNLRHSSLNFHMMTGARAAPPESATANGKIFIQSDAQGIDGVLWIDYRLFRDKILAHIPETISKAFVTMWGDHDKNLNYQNQEASELFLGFIDTDSRSVNSSATSQQGTLVLENHGYRWRTTTPWQMNLQADSVQKSTLQCFRYSLTENVSVGVSIDVERAAGGLCLKVILESSARQRLDRYRLPRSILTHMVGIDLAFGFGDLIVGDGFPKNGSTDNKDAPSSVKVVFYTDTDGRLTPVAQDSVDGVFSQNLIGFEGFDARLKAAMGTVHNALVVLASDLRESLAAALKASFTTKVILPLGSVYTYKNLQLYQPSDRLAAESNAVFCDIRYTLGAMSTDPAKTRTGPCKEEPNE